MGCVSNDDKKRPRSKVLNRLPKPDVLAKKAKSRCHLRWLAGPLILPNHTKQPALALPTPRPTYDIWGRERIATPVTVLGDCFIKIELPILGLKLKRKVARIRSLFLHNTLKITSLNVGSWGQGSHHHGTSQWVMKNSTGCLTVDVHQWED